MITLTQPTRTRTRTRRQSLSWRPGQDFLPELHEQTSPGELRSRYEAIVRREKERQALKNAAHDAAILGLVRDMTTLDESYSAPVNSPLRQYPFPQSHFSKSPFTKLPSAHYSYDLILGER